MTIVFIEEYTVLEENITSEITKVIMAFKNFLKLPFMPCVTQL